MNTGFTRPCGNFKKIRIHFFWFPDSAAFSFLSKVCQDPPDSSPNFPQILIPSIHMWKAMVIKFNFVFFEGLQQENNVITWGKGA